MSDYVNKYCRIQWTLDNFSRESLEATSALNSDNFSIKVGNQILEWHLKIVKNSAQTLSIEGSDIDQLQNKSETTNDDVNTTEQHMFKMALCLNNPNFDDLHIPLVILRCFVLNSSQKETFLFVMKAPLNEFTVDKHWGSFLNMNKIFDSSQKFIIEKSLTFVLHISLNIRKCEGKSHNNPNGMFFMYSLYSDFTIICNDREIPVHRNILHAASPVFAAMFQAPMSEAEYHQTIIDDLEGSVVLELIRFIYTGSVKNLRHKAMDLLNAAEKYELYELKETCIESLSLNLSVKNIFNCLILADRHNNEVLLRNCLGFVKMNHKKLINRKEWSSMDGKILARAIAATIGDFLYVYEFRDTLVSGSDFDSISIMEFDNIF